MLDAGATDAASRAFHRLLVVLVAASVAAVGLETDASLVRSNTTCCACGRLIATLESERKALLASAVVLMGLALIAASAMHLVEHDARPDKFGALIRNRCGGRSLRSAPSVTAMSRQ